MTDITPPLELMRQWREQAPRYRDGGAGREEWLIEHAAGWGADQELEACCEWMSNRTVVCPSELRAARRPKPPSLKEQALVELDNMIKVTVELTYFKRNGKFYDAGKFLASMHTPLYRIWEKVRYMQEQGNLPGLIDGAGKEFNILVNAPGHPHDHPHIVMTTHTSEGD